MRVACLGPAGTFSEEATRALYNEDEYDIVLLPAISAIFETLSSGAVDIAVVPERNSLVGRIEATASGLARLTNVRTLGEVILPVHQHLLGVHGSSPEQIREVWSNPAALKQCSRWLLERGVRCHSAESTAESARLVAARGRSDSAAIASEYAAERYGLSVLIRDIQDLVRNETRFIAITCADK